MPSIVEKRISCTICGTVKTIISTTNLFDIGDWKEFESPNPENNRKVYLCDGCALIFKQLWKEWMKEEKPKKETPIEKPDIEETQPPKKRGRPPKKKEGE